MLKVISLFCYYAVGNKLPSSFFPLGRLFNFIRVQLIRKFLHIGDGCVIERYVNLGKGVNISIGDNCEINEYVYIQGARIGNHVLIAPYTCILSKFHGYQRVDIPMAQQGTVIGEAPVIEDDVWIGRNVVIMPNVVIGTGSIIGANAVVTKNIDPYSVVGGVPAKLIRKRV